jgi:hypothetical protein
MVHLEDGWVGLPRIFDHWDYATVLTLRRELNLDVDEIRRATDSGPNVRLAWSVSVESSSTRIRRCVYKLPAEDSTTIDHELEPTEIGGRVKLETMLVVDRSDPASDLSPTRNGSILWKDAYDILLEGDAARFPIQIVTFETAGLPVGAAWRIEVDTMDLELPAPATIRIKVNRGHAAALAMALHPTSGEVNQVLEGALRFDLARRLLRVLAESDVSQESKFHAGSLGEAMVHLLDLYLPDENIRSLRHAFRDDAARLEAELQHAMAVFQVQQ